jgi:hypothetical protein
MNRCLRWARPLAGSLALIVGLTLAAPPAFAGEPQTAAPVQPLAAAAAAKVNSLPAEALAPRPAQDPGSMPSGDKPFFKTRKGAIAGVLLAAALGYMAYSMSDDRVKSPAK